MRNHSGSTKLKVRTFSSRSHFIFLCIIGSLSQPLFPLHYQGYFKPGRDPARRALAARRGGGHFEHEGPARRGMLHLG